MYKIWSHSRKNICSPIICQLYVILSRTKNVHITIVVGTITTRCDKNWYHVDFHNNNTARRNMFISKDTNKQYILISIDCKDPYKNKRKRIQEEVYRNKGWIACGLYTGCTYKTPWCSLYIAYIEEYLSSCSPKKLFPTEFQLAWKFWGNSL